MAERYKKADHWIDDVLKRSRSEVHESALELELSDLLVETCYAKQSLVTGSVGPLLAAAFDLLVASQYYASLSHSGWLYCPGEDPRMYFQYTNCCPRDVLADRFHFHPSRKPQSGIIGKATSRLLILFYQSLFRHHSRSERILCGTEPVDAIVVDDKKKRILFAEIKASPLLTPPVSMTSQRLTAEKDGRAVSRSHTNVDNTGLFDSPLDMLVPVRKGAKWTATYFPLGVRANAADRSWGVRGVLKLLKTEKTFFERYFAFWHAALRAYHPKDTHNVYWLTNACGTPSPVPDGWPSRRDGSGFESVSDSKTSVGMDRTDDIKKGIYQVLKMGSVGKPHTSAWGYKVGLISNIHAARHFDEYLESLKDIVWTIDVSGRARRISDLSAEQPLYSLFDGIVALTQTLSRDEWIGSLFRL